MNNLLSVRITLPLPPRVLSPNSPSPGNWRKKAKAVQQYRKHACMMTFASGGGNLRWTKAIAQATFFWPTKQRRDVRNAEASLKAAYDGIVDAGLIIDDNYEVLTHYPTAFFVDAKQPRVEITLFRIGRDGKSYPAPSSTMPIESEGRLDEGTGGKIYHLERSRNGAGNGHCPPPPLPRRMNAEVLSRSERDKSATGARQERDKSATKARQERDDEDDI